MLDLVNKTPFAAALVPGLTKEGIDTVTVVVKGTFALPARGGQLRPHEEQEAILHADTHHGEPGLSSIHREADAYPQKKRTDLVLVGHAYAPRGATSVDVKLAVGRVEKTVRVFGDRVWHRAVSDFRPSSPVAFDRMPLRWERAFGGVDTSDLAPEKHAREPRNPLGTGLIADPREGRIADVRLPNLEDPAALITSPADRPAPQGFGYVGRDFHPRAAFAGTYDAAWERDTCPLLPADFDERYFNAAPAGLIAPRTLAGGEPVLVENASPGGPLRFEVPRRTIDVDLWIRDAKSQQTATLDSIRVEPDAQRFVAVWKVTVPCPRSLLLLHRARIQERKAA
ncbi:MAG: DUF2169 domain-containing protein [Polyangiaceae bacterium]